MFLTKEELEEKLQYTISQKKFDEILSLPFISLSKVRTNLTFKTFNRLFVLGRAPSAYTPGGQPISCWWCICNCPEHNIVSVRVNNLTSKNSKSCGCLDKEKATERIKQVGHKSASDLTNQRFGKLVALYATEKRKNGSVVWHCQCDCGNSHEVTSIELSRGGTFSCGCLTESKGSFKIRELLTNANIPFTTEKTFSDCRFKDTNCAARFDFWIDNAFLVEFDGKQHFKEASTFFKDSLEKRQAHDEFKTAYCKNNNIPLKRIPYTAEKTLTLEDILGDKYLV